ncbi:ABC transporter substrate-binding protein [Specibacter sp. RAF43]|uniref:ABC transporter substrate-binding protein n=1 Tax=Specibacter sp. RAF43 TaxID=3233057 RepID=UPI003F9B4DB3
MSTPTQTKKPFSRKLLTGAALAVIGAVAVGCGPAATPAAKSSATVVFQPSTESFAVMSQLAAFAENGFTAAGLDVTYNAVISNAAQVAQSVTSNANIAIVGTSGVLPGVAAGRDIVSVATLTKGPTTQITLRNDVIQKLGVAANAPIADRIKALKGLRLALPQPGSLTDLAVRESLSLYGLNADKDVTVRPISEPAALVTAMRERQVDGFAFSSPTSVQPVAEGYAQVWLTLSDIPEFKALPYIDVVTSRAYLAEHRAEVVKFVRVLKTAADNLEKNPDATAVAIKAKYFPDLAQKTFDLAFKSNLSTALRGFRPEKDGFNALVNMVNNHSDKPVTVKFDQVYDLSILDEIEKG